MNDSQHPIFTPAMPPSASDSYYTLRADYDAHTANLRDQNKVALFDALHAANIGYVVVSFDGYGDSGQVESIEAKAGDENVALPPIEIAIAAAVWGSLETETRSMSLEEAVEWLAYNFLQETHGGWENNDGAYGDFTFDVAARTITLDFNERYTASENYTHEFRG